MTTEKVLAIIVLCLVSFLLGMYVQKDLTKSGVQEVKK